jgi:hypothetical protein
VVVDFHLLHFNVSASHDHNIPFHWFITVIIWLVTRVLILQFSPLSVTSFHLAPNNPLSIFFTTLRRKNLCGLSLRANYTDRAIAVYRRS